MEKYEKCTAKLQFEYYLFTDKKCIHSFVCKFAISDICIVEKNDIIYVFVLSDKLKTKK